MSNKNMFALLNDSDGDEDQAPKQAAPKKESKPEASAGKSQGDKPRNERKPRNRDDRAPRESNDAAPADRERGGKGNRRDYGDRAGGKGKGRKGESRGDSGREYPRRSGTGRGRENPRQGSGKYNWGKDTDGANTTSENEPAAEGTEPAAEGAEAPAAAEIEQPEEEEKTLSYDEYLKAQQAKADELNSLNKKHDAPDVAAHEYEGKTADVEKADDQIEDEYACMFHGRAEKKKHGHEVHCWRPSAELPHCVWWRPLAQGGCRGELRCAGRGRTGVGCDA